MTQEVERKMVELWGGKRTAVSLFHKARYHSHCASRKMRKDFKRMERMSTAQFVDHLCNVLSQ